MLIQTDINELGDKRLNPAEGVVKLREQCLKDASKYKIEDQQQLQDAKRSEGARLSYTELLTRLQKIVPDLVAREGSAGNLALYCPRNTDQLDAALREGGSSDFFFIFNRYVGGMPKEELPEWGYVDIDTSLVATREHLRGWRTILIGLIRCGVLSYADAVAEFGDPSADQRNTVWMKKLLEWRENPTQRFTLRDIVEARKT
jgi:hypothetical protein